jgi:hypothetical protein
MPGEGLTHGPPATKKAGGSHHRISRTSGIPCAIVYSLYVISPGTGSLAPVARVMRSIIRELGISTGMPEPHDFAVRLQHDRRRAFCVHRSPLLRFVTIGRNAPLHRRGMAGNIVLICPTAQARTPATNWHDGQFAHEGDAGTPRRQVTASEAIEHPLTAHQPSLCTVRGNVRDGQSSGESPNRA